MLRNYWEIKSLSNDENQKVINEYLLTVKNQNRSKNTLARYRRALECFFKNKEAPFFSIKPGDIQQWKMEY